MNPVLFESAGVLPTDKYLPGQYAWSAAQRVTGAVLDLLPPWSGVLTLTLEVDGSATAVAFTVPSNGPALSRQRYVLQPMLRIAANAVVRWRANFTGLPEDAASQLALMLEATPETVAQVRTSPAALTVDYDSGLTLYRYSAPSNYALVNRVTGASVQTSAGNLVVSLASPFGDPPLEVLRVESGVVWARGVVAMGGTAPDDGLPVLRFSAGQVSLATVGAAGLRVPNLTEATPVAGQDGVFEWWDASGLTAVLGLDGLVAKEIREVGT